MNIYVRTIYHAGFCTFLAAQSLAGVFDPVDVAWSPVDSTLL